MIHVLLWLSLHSAFADDAAHATYNVKMTQLAEKGAWPGVDKAFRDMQKDKITPTAAEWMLAAQAARNMGDAATALARLTEAERAKPSEETADAIAEYKASWASVNLTARPGEIGLAAAERPFQTDRATAIDYAAAQVGKKGAFEGLLPEGAYSISGVPFEVAGGAAKPLVVDARQGKVDEALAAKLREAGNVPKAPGSRTIPLAAGAGGALVLSGVSFALASQAQSKWASDEVTVDELDALRGRANLLTVTSVVSGAAAIGLGTSAVLFRF